MTGLSEFVIRTRDDDGLLQRSGFRWVELRPMCRTLKIWAGFGCAVVALACLAGIAIGGGMTAAMWFAGALAASVLSFWSTRSCHMSRAIIFRGDGKTDFRNHKGELVELGLPHREIVNVEAHAQPYNNDGAMQIRLIYKSGQSIAITANQYDPDSVRVIVVQVKEALDDLRQSARAVVAQAAQGGVEW
jgi:hypothetical protein